MTVQIDFTTARQLIRKTEELMDEIEGFTTAVDAPVGTNRRNNPELAGVSRSIVVIADMLGLASAEARLQFHALKGVPDPRTKRN